MLDEKQESASHVAQDNSNHVLERFHEHNTIRVFQHEPIRTSAEQIRLFKLDQDSVHDGIVEGTIKHTTLKGDHVCLSYMWGPEKDSNWIRINGLAFQVRQNLWNFLKDEGRRYANEWLWIDAICIDQANLAERNHQVGMMGSIFSKAKKVLVYAGSGNTEIEQALDYSESWVRSLGKPETAPKDCEKLYPHDVHRRLWGRHERGFYAVCRLPYWDRAWIKQEIGLAQNLIFIYGKSHCHWETITMIFGGGLLLGSHSQEIRKSDISEIARSFNPTKSPLYYHLSTFKHLQCSDPRDRIYSLLGISCDGAELTVDYKISCTSLFIRTLLFWNRKGWDWRLFETQMRRSTLENTAETEACILNMFQGASPDWSDFRNMCNVLSLSLFEVEFLNLSLQRMPQVIHSLGLGSWETTSTFTGSVIYIASEDALGLKLDTFCSSRTATIRIDTLVGHQNFKADFTLMGIGNNVLLASSAKFDLPEKTCFICRETVGGEIFLFAIASYILNDQPVLPSITIESVYAVQSSIIVSYAYVQTDSKNLSRNLVTGNTGQFVLYLNLASALELSQLADKISRRKLIRDDTLSGRSYAFAGVTL